MGDAHGGIGLVHVLAPGAGGPVGVDAQVGGVDVDLHVLGLGQHRHGGRRGVDAPLRLRGRHPLHPVHPAFELQPPEHPVAGDGRDDFLIAAGLALGNALDLHAPAVQGGIALVHAKKVPREQGRLVAAGARAHLQDGRGVLVLVLGRQQQGHLPLQPGQPVLQRVQLLPGQGRHLGVAALGHGLQFGRFAPHPLQLAHRLHHRLQLGVLLGQTHDLRPIRSRPHPRLDLAIAVEHLFETGLGVFADAGWAGGGLP